MQKTLLFFTIVFAMFFPCGSAEAFTLAPSNDSAYNATDLGALPAPGLCPANPKGAYDSISGTTLNATYSAEQYSSLYPYSNPSPDVWYKFQATGAFFYCELTGLNGWQNFYIKIHYSEGSSITLLPGGCATPTGNFLSATFPTPTLNGEYYLEIGGDSPSSAGDFFLKYKAFNDCGGCVKMATVDFEPAPVFGKYNPGDTVQMCVTMDRYSSLTSSYFHSIVPEFGSDWDVSTLTWVQAPITQESTGGEWAWFTNISTPVGNADGFFFDADSDGDPTNNHGDNGQVLSSWTGCWKIVANHPCNSGDLDVMIHLYSDAETGNGSSFSICYPYDAIEVATTSTCCSAPGVVVTTNGNCNTLTGMISITPDPVSNTDSMNYFLLDASHHIIRSATNVVGPTSFINIPPGNYILWCVDLSNGNCTSYVSVVVNPAIATAVVQTATGCGSGTGSALVAVTNGGVSPFTYNWVNVNAADQNDSVAFNLQDGWVHVIVTDATGCTVQDSINITSQSSPDPWFEYDPVANCENTDTIHVLNTPQSPSGTFTLVAPTGAGISVDPANGDIFLNNTTHATPFYVYVSYTITGVCSASYTDSALVVGVPAIPTATSSTSMNWCIGTAVPVLNVTVPPGSIGGWYDVQTTATTLGNSFTPPLSASTTPGLYTYLVSSVSLSAGFCTSNPVIFFINALPVPVVTTSGNPVICMGDTTIISTNGCNTCTYQWSPMPTSGIGNLPFAVTAPASTVVYSVTATEQNGCSTTAYSAVTVGSCGTTNTFSVYSGLTPNGDGLNDAWIIDGIDSLMNINVTIFNRWGVNVWESNKYNNNTIVFRGLDQEGGELTDGTYFYIVTLNNEQHTGWIELSRK